MPKFANMLRRFWLPRLNEVSGRPTLLDLRAWISDQNFQIYSPIQPTFQLNYSDQASICQAIAGETVRMSTAALESVASIQPVAHLPKSKAWAVVQWYYAAFYSAHALLRMFGHSLVILEAGHARDIQQIATLYGQTGTVSSGFHLAEVHSNSRIIEFSKMAGSGGSHEFMWQTFDRWLDTKSKELLATAGSTLEVQQVATKLDDLRAILNTQPAQRGSWLSYIRNRVNYRHEFATWHPYAGHDDSDLRVFAHAALLPSAADSIHLPVHAHVRPLERFLAACRFIIALCFDMSAEMSARCPTGNSFHDLGMLHLENLLGQDRPTVPQSA